MIQIRRGLFFHSLPHVIGVTKYTPCIFKTKTIQIGHVKRLFLNVSISWSAITGKIWLGGMKFFWFSKLSVFIIFSFIFILFKKSQLNSTGFKTSWNQIYEKWRINQSTALNPPSWFQNYSILIVESSFPYTVLQNTIISSARLAPTFMQLVWPVPTPLVSVFRSSYLLQFSNICWER